MGHDSVVAASANIAMVSSSAVERLAGRTRLIHEALQDHPRLVRLQSPELTLEDYRGVLHDHYLYFAGIEGNRALHNWWPEFSLADAIARLKADLKAAGVDADAPQYSADASYFPDWATPVMCLGGLYVLFGAQFGGRMLGHMVAKTLPDVPRGFFSDALDTLPQWRSLLEQVEITGADADDFDMMARGAVYMFHDFGVFLSRPERVPVS